MSTHLRHPTDEKLSLFDISSNNHPIMSLIYNVVEVIIVLQSNHSKGSSSINSFVEASDRGS